jgi:hypothetical protein
MKSLACLVGLLCLTGIAFGQEYQSRQPYPDESRRVAGLKNYAQDEFSRANTPLVLNVGLLYLSTNSTDGIIIVKTNDVLVHIGLPNPTNNIGRKFQVQTMSTARVVLTNWYAVSTFTSNATMAEHTSYWINSNKTVMAFSSGTNWITDEY